MTRDTNPTRSSTTWMWLLADLSLDRTIDVLPLVGWHKPNILPTQSAIRSLGEWLEANARFSPELRRTLVAALAAQLPESAVDEVVSWMERFPCDGENVLPGPSYWRRRMLDLFGGNSSSFSIGGVNDETLRSLKAAIVRSKSFESSTPEAIERYAQAMSVNQRYDKIKQAIDKARQTTLSKYDLDIYLRFRWNDFGDAKGLGSLELGVMNQWIAYIWRCFSTGFSKEEKKVFEDFMHQRDLDNWNAVIVDKNAHRADAAQYGVELDDYITTAFPKPDPPPPLDDLLEIV